MYLAKKTSKSKKKKVQYVSSRIDSQLQPESRPTTRLAAQPTLHDFFVLPGAADNTTAELLEATGDPLLPKSPGHIRVALQNPNGIRLKDNVDVLPEVAAMEQLQIDAASFPESKLASTTCL
jgi:hypothetical protein